MQGKTGCWAHEEHHTDQNSMFEAVETLKEEHGEENIKVKSYRLSGLYHGDVYVRDKDRREEFRDS